MCQSSLLGPPVNLGGIMAKIVQQGPNGVLEHSMMGNLPWKVISAVGVRYFAKAHKGFNLLQVYSEVAGKYTLRVFYPHEMGMLHIKGTVQGKEVQMKLYPKGSIMMTIGGLPGDQTRTNLALFLESLQDYLETLTGHKLKSTLNLVRLDLEGFQGGAFDREDLKLALQKDFRNVKNSETSAERVQAFHKTEPSFSVLFQRRGKVQVICSSKGRKEPFTLKDAFAFVQDIQQVIQSLGQTYNKNIFNTFDCHGNPVPEPRAFSGNCPEGFFMIPSKEGRPCCKPVPKYIKGAAFRKSITKKYASHGLELPHSLQVLMGLVNKPNKKAKTPSPKVSPSKVTCHGKGVMSTRGKQKIYTGFFVNGKECYKYPVKDLKELGKKLGLDIRFLKTGANICEDMDRLSRTHTNVIRRTNQENGKRVTPLKNILPKEENAKKIFDPQRCGKGAVKRGFYTMKDLHTAAKFFGIRGYSKMKKEELCAVLKERVKA